MTVLPELLPMAIDMVRFYLRGGENCEEKQETTLARSTPKNEPEPKPNTKQAKRNLTGVMNYTNPGAISHNEILSLYKEYVDEDFTWSNFTVEEVREERERKRGERFFSPICLLLRVVGLSFAPFCFCVREGRRSSRRGIKIICALSRNNDVSRAHNDNTPEQNKTKMRTRKTRQPKTRQPPPQKRNSKRR